ncbi:MAG: hypothetical protein V3U80_02400 [Flavobacteriaceae bacterium]
MFGRAFKSRANYVFDYKPRYYNERKERLDSLEEKYHGNKESSDENYKMSLSKENLRSDWNRNKHMAHDRKANLRLALIIVILVGIFAFLFVDHKLF